MFSGADNEKYIVKVAGFMIELNGCLTVILDLIEYHSNT
jgi:hypothetical protein